MGKEARIGLVVVGVLTGALLGLLLKRFVLTRPPAVRTEAESLASQPQAIPADDKPTVVTAQNDSVTAQRDAPEPFAGGVADNARSTGRDDARDDVPHGSFLPADDLAPSTQRYAQPDEPAPAGDPFHQRFARDTPVADPGAEPAAAPQEFDVAPDGAAALNARRPPKRPTRNPLRQLSAEVPIEDGPADDGLYSPADRYQQDDHSPAADGAHPDLDAGGQFDDGASATPHGNQPFDASPIDAELPGLQPATEPHPAVAHGARDAPFDVEPDGAIDDVTDHHGDPFDPSMPGPAEQPRHQTPAGQQEFGVAETPRRQTVAPVRPPDGRYTIQPNDNLWKISQKVYGDGRFYKAIGEHNRATLKHPDRLSAGDVIEVPPAGVLAQNYPALSPKERRSALVPSRTVQAAATAPISGGNVYVVIEGDTLFDIARYELGKASRWGEIYELNRDSLGSDFDFLQPGLQLQMPSRGRAANPATSSRQPRDRYVR